VAPRGCEVELQRAPAHREPERLPPGERRQCEDVAVRLAEPERETRRCHFDDPSAGPSHDLSVATRVYFEDIRHRLETVL
jgi:hypothetical protein